MSSQPSPRGARACAAIFGHQPLWDQFTALLPEHKVSHPWGAAVLGSGAGVFDKCWSWKRQSPAEWWALR